MPSWSALLLARGAAWPLPRCPAMPLTHPPPIGAQHVSSMLTREQRNKVKQILEILPLRAERGASASDPRVLMSVCGLNVPNHMPSFQDAKQAEVGGEGVGGVGEVGGLGWGRQS